MRKTRTIGLLAILVMLAVLFAIDGMATLTIIEGNGTDASDSYGRVNTSSMNITIISTGFVAGSQGLSNITECNATLSNIDNKFGGNTSVDIIIASDAAGTVNWINMTGLNFSGTTQAYGYNTLTDGRYRLTSVVCLNLSGGDTENSSEIEQDLYFDFTNPSEPILRTDDGEIFDNKKDVEINVTVSDVKNTSYCVYYFEGAKKPGNVATWIIPVNETTNACVGTWNTTDLTEGVYRYTVAGYDGLNISVNYSGNTANPVFYEFQVKDRKMSPYLKAQELKDAGYTSLETQTGEVDLTSLSFFGEEGGLTSSNNMFALIVVGLFVYLLFFHKKKK